MKTILALLCLCAPAAARIVPLEQSGEVYMRTRIYWDEITWNLLYGPEPMPPPLVTIQEQATTDLSAFNVRFTDPYLRNFASLTSSITATGISIHGVANANASGSVVAGVDSGATDARVAFSIAFHLPEATTFFFDVRQSWGSDYMPDPYRVAEMALAGPGGTRYWDYNMGESFHYPDDYPYVQDEENCLRYGIQCHAEPPWHWSSLVDEARYPVRTLPAGDYVLTGIGDTDNPGGFGSEEYAELHFLMQAVVPEPAAFRLGIAGAMILCLRLWQRSRRV